MALSDGGQDVMQVVYAAIGDCADGKLGEEELSAVLQDAGAKLDERQQGVVTTLLNSK
jgi:ribosomal protein L12E/L44/L45/RPP1/RPP2